jgi:hypothetical protein
MVKTHYTMRSYIACQRTDSYITFVIALDTYYPWMCQPQQLINLVIPESLHLGLVETSMTLVSRAEVFANNALHQVPDASFVCVYNRPRYYIVRVGLAGIVSKRRNKERQCFS